MNILVRCALVLILSACQLVTAQNGQKEVCATTEFHCYESKDMCIPSGWKCDKTPDCENGEDERHCIYNGSERTCGPSDFRCESTGLCILREWQCDGNLDCQDGSDEDPYHCQNRICGENEFKCIDHGNCISATLVCDNKSDCGDGSDELSCNSTRCSENEMRCNDGECVDAIWWCDKEKDCEDNSDEINCEEKRCQENEFRCKNGECVPMSWRCDTNVDCMDHSDEQGCKYLPEESNSCGKDFKCVTTGECIHGGWRCDGDKDCPDGSDEATHICGVKKKCSADKFQCDNGECIAGRFNCSGQPECMDGSDEKNCGIQKCDPVTEFDCGEGKECIPQELVCDTRNDCGNFEDEPRQLCGREGKCAEDNGGCDQLCMDTPAGHVCSCFPGYKMTTNNTCEDVDECLEYGSCSQVCENLDGGHKCSCLPGYKQSPQDQTSCVVATGSVPGIVFTRKSDIRLTMLSDKPRTTSLVNGTRSAAGVDYHHEAALIFWSESFDKRIYRTKINDNLRKHRVVVDGEAIEGLAVDWVYDNLYYVRINKDKKKSIAVTDFNGRNHVDIITENLEKPRSLAVKPSRGWLFWSDWGKEPRIEMANMDGSNRKVLVKENILWPNGISLDPVHDTLYWVDAKLHKIFSVDVMSGEVHQVLYDPNNLYHPYSIAIFEDQVFWTDRRSDSSTEILKANKFTGENILQHKKSHSGVVPINLKVYHSLVQPSNVNQCRLRTNRCSHLCVPHGQDLSGRQPRNLGETENMMSVCLCPQGMKLDVDGATCILDGSMPTTPAPTPPSSLLVKEVVLEEEEEALQLLQDQTLLIALVVAVTAFFSVACTLITFYLCKRYKPVSHEGSLSKCVVQTKGGYQPPIRATMAKFHESESMVPLQRPSPDPELEPPV